MKLKLIFFLFIGIFAFAENENAIDYYKAGQEAFSKKDYYKAADLFKQALIKNPYYREAFAGAGNAYFEMGNFLESRKFYEKALFYEPENIDFILKMALIKIKSSSDPKEILGAEYYLLKAFKKEPRNSKVLMVYGDYFYEQGHFEKAREFYDKAKRSDNNFLAYLKLASIYKRWKNYEKAYDLLIQAENINSTDYRVTFDLGKFYLERKRYEEARKYLELTLKFYPQFKEGLSKLIEFYITQEKYAEAIQRNNELLELDPENPILYYHMAICYERLRQYEQAIEFLMDGQKYDFSDEVLIIKAEEIAVKHLPLGHQVRKRLSEPYMEKGNIAYRKNQVEQAIVSYKRGLRINPLSVEMRKKLAKVYIEKGWVDLYVRTLKAGLFVEKDNLDLKDQISLYDRFLWETISYEKKIDQYKNPAYYPTVYLSHVMTDAENRHISFKDEIKEIILEAAHNTYSVNIKEGHSDILKLSKKGNLLLRVKFYEDERKVELEGELIALSTGNIFKKYFIRRYGNQRLMNAAVYLAKQVSKDVVPFGKIISVDDDLAVINIGKLQHIKVKDRFVILNSRNVIDEYYSGNSFKKQWVIGEAEVVKVDEQLALVKLEKSRSVVFNMININDIVITKKPEEKKEGKKKTN